MFRIQLPESGNGWTRRLTYLILIGYVVLIFSVVIFVIVSTIHELGHL